MTANRYDVILVGPYYCDLIFTGLKEQPRLGTEVFGTGIQMGPGGNFNTAFSMHRLGLKIGWICDFGADFFSQLVLEKIQQVGMDTSFFRIHGHNLCAISAAFSCQEDRGFISYLDPIKPGNIIPVLQEFHPRCLLIGGTCLGDDFMDVSEAAHKIGTKVAMDWQHCNLTLEIPAVREMLSNLDIFIPNISEVRTLTGIDEDQEAMRELSHYPQLLVVKMGKLGATVFSGGEFLYVPGIKIPEVVDTTGAGDCFNAGFLYSYLRDQPFEQCLKSANICGGLSVTSYGVSQVPTGSQVLELIDQYDALVAGAPNLFPQHPNLGFVSECSQ